MDLNFNKNEDHNKLLIAALRQKLVKVKLGGGKNRIEKHHAKGKMTARERIEYLLDPKTKNKTGKVLTTIDADKEFGGGLYAIITNKEGQRIYMNNEGDMRPLDDTTTHDDLEKDGYELVFTNIPNIVKTSKPGEPDRYTQTMGDNMLLNELGEVLGQSPAKEWDEVSGNNVITIRGNNYNLTNKDDLLRVKEILKNNIYVKMSKFRENVENELNKDKKVYVEIKDISNGFQLSRSKDEELNLIFTLVIINFVLIFVLYVAWWQDFGIQSSFRYILNLFNLFYLSTIIHLDSTEKNI